jgi:hypothetical protein
MRRSGASIMAPSYHPGMAAQRRNDGPRPERISSTEAADDIRRFAQLVKASEQKAKAERDAERQRLADERRVADEAEADARRFDDATSAKERAARTLKERRARGASAGSIAEAEAAYKTALAALVTIEQGEAPDWAPAPPSTEASDDGATADDEPGGGESPDAESAVGLDIVADP